MSTQKCEIGAPYGAAEGALTTSATSAMSSFLGFAGGFVTACIRYRAFRKAERELHALDDRMLNDIGLNRSEITSALTSAANERRMGWRI